jgi:hypothetical protein
LLFILYPETRLLFYFVFKDLIAFDFVNRDLIALYFYLNRPDIPNNISAQTISTNPTYQTHCKISTKLS